MHDDHVIGCTSAVGDKPPQSSDLAKLLLSHSSAKVTYVQVEEQFEKMSVPIAAYKKGTLIRSMHMRNICLVSNFTSSFGYFKSYLKHLLHLNSGSQCEYEVAVDADGNTRFGRLALILKSEINVAVGAKPIISLDGGFMKHGLWGSYQILVCGTQDGEGRDCSLGFALCPVESEQNYSFFINTMKKSPALKDFLDQKGLVVTSDRCKGLLNTVTNNLPNSYHRYCALHLLGNIKGGRNFNEEDRTLYWNIVYAGTEVEFNSNMDKLKLTHKEAYEYLKDIDPKFWTNWAFPGRTWDHVTNNLSERAVKYIGCDLDDGRKQPITELIDNYVDKVS